MSCDKIKPLIGPFRDGELDGVEQRAVASHLETCTGCAAALSEDTKVGSTI